MSARKTAVVLLAAVLVSWMPAAGVAATDVASAQAEPDDQEITAGEITVTNLTLDDVTVRNLSVASLNVTDDAATDAPSSIDDETVTVTATMRDVTFENVTIRNQSLAQDFLGIEGQELQNRTEGSNETVETGLAQRNTSLNDTTIDGAAFDTVVVENVTGNLSLGDGSVANRTGDGNETGAQTNETGAEPAIEAANVTVGHLDTTGAPAGDGAEAAAANETTETPVDNATESAEGGASDVIIGDENLTQPSWANKTGNNETDVTGSGNWTNGTAGNGTQIGGEVGEDLTAGNESDATGTPAGNATETPSGNASLNVDR